MITGQQHTISGGQTVTIGDLPVGAQCWAVETVSSGAAASKVSSGSAQSAVQLAADGTSTITVTNTFDPQLPPPSPSTELPGTGVSVAPWLSGGLGVATLGVVLLLGSRSRR